jgi:UDP-N-acetyl-D-mannosaminuronate dehydrogenase
MYNIGIIGYGEIGSSLYKVYNDNLNKEYNLLVLDPSKGKTDELTNCYILNICIPFSSNFVELVNSYIDSFNPYLTVIHSTIAPGTTQQITGRVCHSPIRGVHPNLASGIKTFLKYIGSEDTNTALEYQTHLKEVLGIDSYICQDSRTSEYAKLLDTTYYGVCIAFHNEVLALCNSEGLNFDEVMTLYNKTYNQGYSILGKPNVVRPVLYGSDRIGGHCVISNAKILNESMNSDLINFILKYE